MQISTTALLSNALNSNSLADLRDFFDKQQEEPLDAVNFFAQDSDFIEAIDRYLVNIKDKLEQLDDDALEEEVVVLNYIIRNRKDYASDHFVLETPKNRFEKITVSFQIQAHIMLVELLEYFEDHRELQVAKCMIDIDPELKEHPATIIACDNSSLQRLRELRTEVAKDKQYSFLSKKTTNISYPLCTQLIKDRIIQCLDKKAENTSSSSASDIIKSHETHKQYYVILRVFQLLQINWCDDEVLLKKIKAHAAIFHYLIDVYVKDLIESSLLKNILQKITDPNNHKHVTDISIDAILKQTQRLLRHADALLKHSALASFILLVQHLTLEQKTVLMDPKMLNIFSRYPMVLLVSVNTKQIDHLLEKIPQEKNRKTMKAYHEFLKTEETALLSEDDDLKSESLNQYYAKIILTQYIQKGTIAQFFMPKPSLVTLSTKTFFKSLEIDSDISQSSTELKLAK